MNTVNVATKAIKIAYSILNLGGSLIRIKNIGKYKKRIKKNSELHNIHNGEVCYILGNGPSINKLDTTLLQGKNIITVNAMINTELFGILKPKYHCIIDSNIYEKNKQSLIKMIPKSNTKFLLHRCCFDDCCKFDNVYITYNTTIPININNINVDLTKNPNIFMNVVPYATMAAIYMGFKKIVLLGCDFSFFAARKAAHFYETVSDNKREESLYQDLLGSAIALDQYSLIYQYALKHNVEIVNATPGSLLDVIPQVELADFIKSTGG